MSAPQVLGGDDIAAAIEQVLRANIPAVLELLDLEELGQVETWQQVPTAEALSTARLPAVAIVAPRMASQALRNATNYDGTWQASVAVFIRGKDHATTQAAAQAWAKVIRVAALLSRRLGTLPVQLRWVGEEYDLQPEKSTARTLGGCEVFFDALAESVMDLSAIRNTLSSAPVVTETETTVTLSN